MHAAYKDDKELCKWLRDNSSGSYRLSGYAAERIETLTQHLANVQAECEKLEADANRYRKLRGKHWNDGGIAIVEKAASIKLGHQCLSLKMLDEALDAEA